MPVTTKHPKYDQYAPAWRRVRDAIEGEDRIKSGAERYLPVPSGMSAGVANTRVTVDSQTPVTYQDAIRASTAKDELDEYGIYLSRAVYYGAVGRTVLGVTGAILRKEPTIKFSGEEALKTITKSGDTFEQLLRTCVQEAVSVTRFGMLVDSEGEIPGEAPPSPYVATYLAENIINWREEAIDGRKTATMVVLEEVREDRGEDPFLDEKTPQWRVLRFNLLDLSLVAEDEANALLTEEQRARGEAPPFDERLNYYDLDFDEIATDNIYWQEIWEESAETRAKKDIDDNDREYVLTRRVFPRRFGGKLWDEMPFEFVNGQDTNATPEPPAILDLVDTNLAHYRNSADLEWGLHLVALPTPYAVGFNLKHGQKLRIGGATAWVSDDPSAKAGMVEFEGAGLASIAAEMDKKETRMAVLGARLLEESKKAAEAAETVRMRHSGDASVIKTTASTCSMALTRALTLLRKWRNESASAEVELRPDLNLSKLTAQELTALNGMLQSGSMSFAAYFHVLSTGEMYPDGWTEEDERRSITTGLPGLPNDEPEEDEEDDEEDDEDPEEDDKAPENDDDEDR